MTAPDPDSGRRRLVERLYRSHYEVVLRYVLRRVDPDTAQDLTAETFLVAWRRLDALPAREAGWPPPRSRPSPPWSSGPPAAPLTPSSGDPTDRS